METENNNIENGQPSIEIAKEETKQQLVEVFLTERMDKLSGEEYMEEACAFSEEFREAILLNTVSNPSGREYLIEESHREDSRLSTPVTNVIKYWDETARWTDLKGFGVEVNVSYLSRLLSPATMRRFCREDHRAPAFIRNMWRGLKSLTQQDRYQDRF